MNNWTFVFLGFAMAVFMGSALVSLLVTVKPEWTARRRRLTAASILPAITAVATLLALLFVATARHGQSEQMEDLALAALMTFGGGFTLPAWIGGLIGATLTSRRRDR
jgi:NADH:ubiquinone oxidoreductase subunit 2 (subunit N)